MNSPADSLGGLRHALEDNRLGAPAEPLLHAARRVYETNRHGDWAKWQRAIDRLPDLTASSCDFTAVAVRIGESRDGDDAARAAIKRELLQLHPWRKGPFELFGVSIDSEWRANLKWERLAAHLSALQDRRVLDVGCGNGYYLWRMLGAGASLALGIDPSQLFIAQFNALKRYCPDRAAFILPLTDQQLPPAGFDSVFSMGVLYHRRDPREHLRQLLACARPGGEVVIETLVVDGNDTDTNGGVLTPAGRYAKMRNVHAIPSPPALERWLQQAGALDIRRADITPTTPAEQRATEWMPFESLTDFLNPANPTQTIEGHPAPKRAIFVCKKPD